MSDLGNFKSFVTPQMSVANTVENQNKMWENFGNMGVALSKLSQEQEQLAADKEYKQQKMALERESLLQDKSQKDRQYLLDYQKTINDSKAKQFDMFKDMSMLQISQDNAAMKKYDFQDKIQRQEYTRQNAQKYAEAYTSGDLSKLSAEDLAMMPDKDRLTLFKSASSLAKTNKDKVQLNNFYDRYGNDLLNIYQNLKVDPMTGKSNAMDLSKSYLEKVRADINNGKIDSRIAFTEIGKNFGVIKKQANLMGGGGAGSLTPPTEFTRFDLDAKGNPVNPSNYILNTPEGQQKFLEDQIKIATDPNANAVIGKITRNKSGISGVTTLKPPKKSKKANSWDDL